MKTEILRTGFALAAFLIAPMAAQAADMPVKAPYSSPSYAPSYANWTGWYVGFNAGYGMGKSDWDSPLISPEPKGALAGITAGYNWQTGMWLWGAEADLDWSGMKGSTDCGGASCEFKNDWLGTARARFGYAGWNNWLPYVTAGAAFGEVKANTPIGDASKTKIGWTAGVGVEYALRSNWSVKVEYLYVDLGSMDCSTACGLSGTTDNVSFKANLVRAGVNYRF
jgi:outer membrane immunogenic protein